MRLNFRKTENKNLSRKYYRKVVLSFFFIALIPIWILSLIYYLYASVSYKQNYIQANVETLNQMTASIELVFRQINDTCSQFFLDTSFTDYYTHPKIEYYENLKGAYDSADLVPLSRYIEKKAGLMKKIAIIKDTNKLIESTYFYNATLDKILTGSTQYTLKDFKDTSWFDAYLSESKSIPIILSPTVSKISGKEIIPLIYKPSSYNSTYSNHPGALIINLDIDKINEYIFGLTAETNGNQLVVITKEGTIVLGDKQNEVLNSICSTVSEKGFPTGNVVINNKDLYIKTIISDVTGWYHAVIFETDKYSLLRTSQIVFSAITLFTLSLIVITITIHSSKKIYRPVRELVDTCQKLFSKKTGRKYDEFDLVNKQMKWAYNKISHLNEHLAESIPAYKEKFLLMLLNGKIEAGSSLNTKLSFFKINWKYKNFIVIILDEIKENMEQETVHKIINIYETRELIRKYLEDQNIGIGTFTENEKEQQILILNYDILFDENFRAMGRDLNSFISQQINCDYYVIFGSPCNDIRKLHESYKNAQLMLQFGFPERDTRVSVYSTSFENKWAFTDYPYSKEEKLYFSIQNLNYENADIAIENFFKQLYTTTQSKTIIQIYSIEFLRNLIRYGETLGLNIYEIFKNHQINYQDIFSNDYSLVIIWFKEAVNAMMKKFESFSRDSKNRHVNEIISIIQNDHSEQITLSSVSDKLNLSSVYVSKIFKECTGKNFSDYLSEIRISEAKNLLEHSHIKIKEISNAVGYGSSRYFIKKFRESVGMTPGNYRNFIFAENQKRMP